MSERTEPPRLWALGFGLWALGDGSSLRRTLAKPSRLRRGFGGHAGFLLISFLLSPGANQW